jgi:hypothetical protein
MSQDGDGAARDHWQGLQHQFYAILVQEKPTVCKLTIESRGYLISF